MAPSTEWNGNQGHSFDFDNFLPINLELKQLFLSFWKKTLSQF